MPIERKIWDMRVRSITKLEREKADTEMTQYKMVARDNEGVNQIVITSANPFSGLSAKDGIVQVILQQSQKSISDFQPEEDTEDEKEGSE